MAQSRPFEADFAMKTLNYLSKYFVSFKILPSSKHRDIVDM